MTMDPFKTDRTASLVNAAGIAPEIKNPQPIWSLPDTTWRSSMGVNATGTLNTCRAATAQMMAQPALAGGDRGWIVNVSSIYGQTAAPGNVAYCASKHAVLGLTTAAALDCAPYKIRVNAMCPGCRSLFVARGSCRSRADQGHSYRDGVDFNAGRRRRAPAPGGAGAAYGNRNLGSLTLGYA